MSSVMTPGCLLRVKRYVHGQNRPGFTWKTLFIIEPGELAIVMSAKIIGGCVLVMCCKKLAWVADVALEDT